MQQLLIEQGYLNAGGADGIFGGGSEKALMQYQKDRDLNPDGIGWPQTLKDLEVICVDDCSPDRCGEILDDYAARDGRVQVIHLQENFTYIKKDMYIAVF